MNPKVRNTKHQHPMPATRPGTKPNSHDTNPHRHKPQPCEASTTRLCPDRHAVADDPAHHHRRGPAHTLQHLVAQCKPGRRHAGCPFERQTRSDACHQSGAGNDRSRSTRHVLADQRTSPKTARKPPPALGNRHWTGVYRSWPSTVKDRPTPEFVSWMVSGDPNKVNAVDLPESRGRRCRGVGQSGTLGTACRHRSGQSALPSKSNRMANRRNSPGGWGIRA